MSEPPRTWTIRSRVITLKPYPLIMGIMNVTPDSFSDGGSFATTGKAVEHGLQLALDGADLLDIGGESTRPGATPVSVQEELDRVIPVVEQLATRVSIPISIDTTKSVVARAAVASGAHIINDISGLQFDPEMASLCAELQVGVVCMHIQGTPANMQDAPSYSAVVPEIADYFRERVAALTTAGIAPAAIMLDPGVGFGKTASHNLDILAAVDTLAEVGFPILIGHSRKRFLKRLTGREVDERFASTLGVSLALAGRRVSVLRVHDVAAHRDALLAWRAVTFGEQGLMA